MFGEQQYTQYREYRYRIVIVILFSMASMINGMCWDVVSPISVAIQNAYEVSQMWVAFIPMSFLIVYILINFPSNWLIQVKGVRFGIIFGTSINLLGCALRCLVNFKFPFIIIGQIFCAVTQPFVLNVPMKIATRWFLPKNRSLAMAILTVVNAIGNAIGFLIPSAFVKQQDDKQTIKKNFFYLLLLEASLSAIATILIIIFFKQSPPSPASKSSTIQNTQFKKSIKIMLFSKKFMLLALSFGCINGTYNIYGSILDDILDPFGFTSSNVSMLGTILMVTGMISAAVFGAYVQRTLKYRNVFIACALFGTFSVLGFPLLLKFLGNKDYFWIYIVLVIFQGLVFISSQPMTIDYTTDIMFPLGQAQITGFMISMGQLFGIIFIQLTQIMFNLGHEGSLQEKQDASFKSVVFCNSFLLLGCIILALQNSELMRSKIDQSMNNQSLLQTQNSRIILSGQFNSEILSTQ